MDHRPPVLQVSKTHTAGVTRLAENSWHLEIPAGSSHRYRLAQLDDHSSGMRSSFLWKAPLRLSLQARVSDDNLPGTWGFGLWNDPFSFLLGFGGVVSRLPSLPETAWFFHASPQNYLSFRDDLPANGLLAATFSSTNVPIVLLALASPVLALTIIPRAAQWVRKLIRRQVRQDAAGLHASLTDWHTYRLEWGRDQAVFNLDDTQVFVTGVVPHSPMTLVMWIDNQYMSLAPAGRLRYGYLPNLVPAWLEVRDVWLQDGT